MSLPHEIIIELTSRCNLDCNFCFNKQDNCRHEELSTHDIFRILDDIVNSGIKAVRFTGGEPFLRTDLCDILKKAKSLDLYVILNTNAFLIDEKNKDYFNYVDLAIFSLHELDRFGTIKEKMKMLEQYRLKIMLATIATPSNIGNIETFYKFIAGINCKNFAEWFILRPIPNNINPKPICKEDIEELYENILRYNKRYNLDIKIANTLPFCAIKKNLRRICKGGGLDSGHTRFVIDCQGNYKRDYFSDCLGNIKDKSILDMWNSPEMSNIRNYKNINPECRNCYLLEKCKGGIGTKEYLCDSNNIKPLASTIIPQDYNKNSMELEINTGFICNNNCRFCIHTDSKFKGNRSFVDIKKDLIDLREICDSVVLSGGEVTIRQDFLDIVRFAKELLYKTIQIRTNGRMFASLGFCKKTIHAGATDFIIKPYGYCEKQHDFMTKSPGSFKQTIKGIKNLNSLGAHVFTKIEDELKQLPDEVCIELINRCSDNCDSCLNQDQNNTPLPFEQFIRIIDDIKRSGIRTVHFTGSEPPLRKDLQEIFKYAKDNCLYVILDTNDALFSNQNFPVLNYVDELLIHFNSLGKKADISKIVIDTKKTNPQTFVKACTTLTIENVRRLEEFYEFIGGQNIDDWSVLRPMPNADNLRPISENTVITAVKKIIELNEKYSNRKNPVHTRIANTVPFCISNEVRVTDACAGGKNDSGYTKIVIDSNGRYKPAHYSSKILGHINENNILEAWNSSYMRDIRNFRRVSYKCRSCRNLQKCKGGLLNEARYAASYYPLDYLVRNNISEGKNNAENNLELRYLTLELTHRCNMSCPICYYHGKEAYASKANDELSCKDYEKFLDTLQQKIPIVLVGGEIFLRKDIMDIIQIIKSKGFPMTIISNGTLINDEQITRMVNLGVDCYVFSLDGDKETNDKIRGQGSFDKTICATKSLITNGVEKKNIIFSSTLSECNINKIESVLTPAKNLGVKLDMHIVSFNNKMPDIDPNVLSNKVRTIQSLANTNNINLDLNKLNSEKVLKSWFSEEDIPSFCGYVNESVMIRPNGDITLCHFIDDVFGNIKEDDIHEVINSDKAKSQRKKINKRLDSACNRCCYLQIE